MPQFQPPPTYANPVLEETDPATGRIKAGFNPVWLKWFLDLAAALSFIPNGGGGGSSGFVVPYKQIIYGNSANFATVSDTFEWQDDIRTLFLGNAEEVGVVSGGDYDDPARGHPATLTVSGSPTPGNHGGFARLAGGPAGTGGGNGGDVEVLGGAAVGSGQGGSVTIAANNSGDAGGPAGDVGIASGAGDAGGDSGNVIIEAAAPIGGGGARGYIFIKGVERVEGFLVADLPAPSGLIMKTIVTDAIAPAFLAAVVGGGAVTTPVFCDGVTWRCG